MKKTLLFILAFPLFGTLLAQNKEITIQSKITEVTVYLQGARVTRTGTSNLQVGTHHLVFRQLPAKIMTNNLEVTSQEDLKIVSVTPRQSGLDDPKANENLNVWKDSLELLELLHAQLQNQREVLEAEQGLMLANTKVGGPSGTKVEDVEDMAELFRTRLPQIKKDLLDLRLREKVLLDKIQRYRNQINWYQNMHTGSSMEVVVIVQTNRSGNVSLTLNYNVQQAYWAPIYDLRTADVSSKPQLAYKAKVMQRTGEEWRDVKLSLATTNPTAGGDMPLLTPQYLDFAAYVAIITEESEIDYDAISDSTYTDAYAFSAVDKGRARIKEAKNKATYSVANISATSPVNTVFQIENKTTIPSTDVEAKTLDIQYFDLPATYSYSSAPKLEPAAFVVARITEFEDLFLLPGQLSVFFGGAYIGETFLNPYATEDTLDIALGRDKRVVIQREKLKEKSSKSFLGGKKTVNYTFEITLKNNRQEAVSISVKDQVPVSNDKSITVEVKETSGASLDKDTGLLMWNLNLAPGETRKVQLSYQVTYPRNKTINGL